MPPPPDRPEFWVEDGPDDSWGPDAGWAAGDEVYGSQTTAWDAPRPTDDEPDVAATAPRRRLRWAALAAGLVVIAGIITFRTHTSGPDLAIGPDSALQTSAPQTSSDTGPPTTPIQTDGPTSDGSGAVTPPQPQFILPSADPNPTTTAGRPATLPGAPFELVGLQWDGQMSSVAALIRYRPDTGVMVRTEIPGFTGGAPVSVVATDDATVVGTAAGGSGFVIPDGKHAAQNKGLLSYSGPVFPAADPHLVWGRSWDYQGTLQLALADPLTGDAAGPVFAIPQAISDLGVGALAPDGAGGILGSAAGGAYELTPDGAKLLTHGRVLAVGPAGLLLDECDDTAKCATVMLDHATGTRTAVAADNGASLTTPFAVMSPDGHHLLTADYSTRGPGPQLTLTDLPAGTSMALTSYSGSGSPPSNVDQFAAFSPDSAVLLAPSDSSVSVIDPTTGALLAILPISHLAAITVRPVG